MTLSPRQRRKKMARTKAYVRLSVVSMLLIALLGSFLYSEMTKVELDSESLCPKSAVMVSEYWAILLDVTDPYSSVQRGSLMAAIGGLRDSVAQYGQIQIYSLRRGDSTCVLDTTFCNPGKIDQPTWRDWLTKNPDRLNERWKSRFGEPIEQALEEIMDSPEASTTPLLESIQTVGLRAFPKPSKSRRRLVVVSDMLQHTPELSQYREPRPTVEALRSTDYFQKNHVELTGVEVTILYARRPQARGGAMQGGHHIDFWRSYFESLGARVTNIKRIEGQ